jgi:hypothetical protein
MVPPGTWYYYSLSVLPTEIAMIAVTLLLQAIFNVACCGSGNCAVNDNKNSTKSVEDTTYEEIK